MNSPSGSSPSSTRYGTKRSSTNARARSGRCWRRRRRRRRSACQSPTVPNCGWRADGRGRVLSGQAAGTNAERAQSARADLRRPQPGNCSNATGRSTKSGAPGRRRLGALRLSRTCQQQETAEHRPGMAPPHKPNHAAHQSGVRVSTRVQLGSGLVVLRSKVQMSITSSAVRGRPRGPCPRRRAAG